MKKIYVKPQSRSIVMEAQQLMSASLVGSTNTNITNGGNTSTGTGFGEVDAKDGSGVQFD